MSEASYCRYLRFKCRGNFRKEEDAVRATVWGLLYATWVVLGLAGLATAQSCPYDPRCLDNPYGAGSPYKADGLMNPYSQYGSPYSNKSWTNPYATDAPKLYDSQGDYRGRLSTNPYASDSTANPYGPYGNPSAPKPTPTNPWYIVPSR